MKTMTVGELKTHFSDALNEVRKGETIVVGYGRKKRKVAALIPYEELKKDAERKIGLYDDTATCKFRDDFKINDAEFLES